MDRRDGQVPAPEDEDAYEVLTERLDFDVRGLAPSDAAADLKPMLGRLTKPSRGRRGLWGLLVVFALCLAGAPFVYRYWVARNARARRRSAYEIASAELAELRSRPNPDASAMDAFFVELSGIVRRYLEARFELRSPEPTTEEFLDVAARSPDLGDELRELLTAFLRRADLVKFARFVPGADEIDASLTAASRLLEETRETKVDEHAPVRPEFVRG